jgi:hypothetical protein
MEVVMTVPFKDMRSEKARNLCHEYKEKGCREACPLSDACKMRPGDNFRIFIERMNKAAESLDKPSGDLSFGLVAGLL